MKECDKRNSYISSKLHVICISSNNDRHPVTKTFTTLHPTTLHSISLHLSTLHFFLLKLHPTTLHYPLIWLNPISISYRYTSPHITSLHLTSFSLQFTALLYDFRHNSIPITSPHITTLHLTSFSLHFTAFLYDFRHTSALLTSPHITTLHLTSLSLHFTALLYDFRHTSIPLTSPQHHYISLHFTAHVYDFRHTSIPLTSPQQHYTSPHFTSLHRTCILFSPLSLNSSVHTSRFSTHRFWYWEQTRAQERTRPMLPMNSSANRKAFSPTQMTVTVTTDARTISKRLTNRVTCGLTSTQSSKAAASEGVLYGPNPRDMAHHNPTGRRRLQSSSSVQRSANFQIQMTAEVTMSATRN